jgi:DNA excision repair protein ERCC-2
MKYFPYTPTKEQISLMNFVSDHASQKTCVDASTGFGKTPSILASLLPLRRRILWAVRTGNESDRPIEELETVNEKAKKNFFGISYRGKKDMCMLARDRGLELDYDSASFLCRKKIKNCPYYKNLKTLSLSVDSPLIYPEIINISKREKICPYYLQRKLLPYAMVIGLSYNYILGDAGRSLKGLVPFEGSFLVVDEAHNLEQVCLSLNSISMTSRGVERAIDELERMNGNDDGVLSLLLDQMYKIENETEVDMESLLSYLNIRESYEDFIEYGNMVRDEKMSRGEVPRSSLFHVGQFFEESLKKYREEGVVFIASSGDKGSRINLWDMRTRDLLKDRWKEFEGCIFCSGTLAPIHGFADTIGLEDYAGKSFILPIKEGNIRAYITKGMSTAGMTLSREMSERYAEAIGNFLDMRKNSAIFCSSYRILETLMLNGLGDLLRDKGIKSFVEHRGMSGDESRRMLEDFKGARSSCLIANAQGRFAEGADFPGEELEAIFIAGIPFERMTLKTKLYIEYFMSLYGRERGRYYAYTVPAMRRVSQSMGRALRSFDDKATIVCGDERYSKPQFFNLLPDYFKSNVRVCRFDQPFS